MKLISFDDFIDKYKNEFVEVAGSANALNQCVDLANLYFREVLGVPIVEWTNAVDFPSKVSKEDFDWIPNTPTAVPQKGDTMIWSGEWGHISMFIEGDMMSFVSFDENWPLLSPCVLVAHSYEGVIGWLRPKKEPMTDNCEELQKVYDHFGVKNYDEIVAWKEREEGFLKSEREKTKFLTSKIETLEILHSKEIKTLEAELEGVKKALKDLTEENRKLKEHNRLLFAQNEILEAENAECTQVDPIVTRFINWIKKLFGR